MKKLKKTLLVAAIPIPALLVGIIVARLIRHHRMGAAERAGQNLDAAIHTAADNLRKAADAIQEYSYGGTAQDVGHNIDEMLDEARGAVEKASGLIREAVLHKASL